MPGSDDSSSAKKDYWQASIWPLLIINARFLIILIIMNISSRMYVYIPITLWLSYALCSLLSLNLSVIRKSGPIPHSAKEYLQFRWKRVLNRLSKEMQAHNSSDSIVNEVINGCESGWQSRKHYSHGHYLRRRIAHTAWINLLKRGWLDDFDENGEAAYFAAT